MAVSQTPSDKNMAAGTFKDEAFNGRSPNHCPLIGEIFDDRYWQKDHVDSFAEKHVKLAKQLSQEQLWAGRNLLEGVQGKHTVLLSSTAKRRVTPDPSSLDYHLVVLVQRKVRPPFRSNLPCPHELGT